MENASSIGGILRNARESRSLSLEQVHDATKITAQNLGALEEDRFETFPNKVYARAFLRDYANYLGLDSADLLTRYEETWAGPVVVEPVAMPKPRGSWRGLGYALLVIILLGGIAAAGYEYWPEISQWAESKRVAVRERPETKPSRTSVLPAPPVVAANNKPTAPQTPNSITQPKPAPSPAAAAPDKLALEVATFCDDWVRVTADGKKIYEGVIKKGETKTFDAKDTIAIRAGVAGGVQIKLNGVLQPSLGSFSESKTATYSRPSTPAAPAPTATTPPATPSTTLAPSSPTHP